jgi:putative flippase GtrA
LIKQRIPMRIIKYALCGSFVTLIGLISFIISDRILLEPFVETSLSNGNTTEFITLIKISVSRHIAAYSISLIICLPIGFNLSKYFVFSESIDKNKVSFSRYLYLQTTTIVMNYFLLYFLNDQLNLTPILSQSIATAIAVICSYLFQRSAFSSKNNKNFVCI